MKVKDRVAQLKPTDYIYLGCKDGSGFFFIGTPPEFDELIDLVDAKITDDYQRSIDATIKQLDKNIDDRDNLKIDVSIEEKQEAEMAEEVENAFLGAGKNASSTQIDRLIKCEETHIEMLNDLKKKKEKILRLNESIASCEEKADSKTDLIRMWVPFAEREIVEEYEHTVDIPGTTLLVGGKVEGNYWLRKEIEPWIRDVRKGSKKEGKS